MSGPWPSVRLGEVLRHRKEFITINDLQIYKRPRVRLHAQGIVMRDEVPGALIKTKKQQLCRAGEFLVAEIDAKVGGFGIVPPELEGSIVSSHYFLFSTNEDRLDRRFLGWFIRTPMFRDQVEAQGSTNYAAIRPGDVLSYEIPVPPLAEQRRVVARIEQLAAKIAEATNLRMLSLETSSLLSGSCHRTVFFPEEMNGPKYRLGDLCTVCRGGSPRPKGDPRYFGGSIPWIMIGDATASEDKFIRSTRETVTEEGAQKSRLLPAGSLVVTNSATIGLPKFLGIAGCIHDGFLSFLDIDARLDLEYLYHYFLAVRSRLEGAAPLGTQKNLNTHIVRCLVVPLPPLEEQHRIVAYLDGLQAKVDALRRLQAETAAELDALLPAILDRAFKGDL